MGSLATESEAKQLIDALRHHERAMLSLHRDEHEYSPPFSFGGPQGNYNFQNPPYTTACQWMLLSVTATGAATAILSALTQQPIVPAATMALDPGAGRDLMPFSFGGAGTIPYSDVWHDFPAYGSMGLAVVTTGAALYVTVVFRRRRSQAGMIAEA